MKFETGANWIHGVLGNPMYEIAMAHGLVDIISTTKPHKVVAATEDGKQVPFSVLQVRILSFAREICFEIFSNGYRVAGNIRCVYVLSASMRRVFSVPVSATGWHSKRRRAYKFRNRAIPEPNTGF